MKSITEQIIKNPWIDLHKSASGQYVLECDKPIIDQLEQYLNLYRFPEPYTGSKDAPVYLLSGNPGVPKEEDVLACDLRIESTPEYGNLFLRNLRHESLAPYNDFIYFNPLKDKCGNLHSGCNWWGLENANKEVTKGHILNMWTEKNRYPSIFDIEFFPYHSHTLEGIPRKIDLLPSYQYTDYLIREAIKAKKLIVVTRMRSEWMKRIPELITYPNVLFLSSVLNISLSSNNVLDVSWEELKNKSYDVAEAKKKGWKRLIEEAFQ